jgi:hypothetical protein
MMQTRMRGRFELWPFVGGVAISAAVASLVWWLSGMPFWICLLLATAGLVVNGYLATCEDEQPGGFNNPNQSQ